MVRVTSFCFFIAATISVNCLPNSINKSLDLYDQRQTGDYNIRLNLKDFHIIAILGGDYNDDYEYDYEIPSDYTDFPMPTTTTSNPSNLSTTTTSTVTINPKPLSTTTTSKPSTTLKSEGSTKASTSILSVTTNKVSSITTTKPSVVPSKITTTAKPPSITTLKVSSTGIPTEKPNKTLAYSYQTGLSGDRIPVIVLQQNEGASKSAMISSHVTILPEESVSEDTERVETLGEIHYKKCPNGYTRDKNGRCRKMRRPPLFDFSRFTSNLASKFRRPEASPVRTIETEKQ